MFRERKNINYPQDNTTSDIASEYTDFPMVSIDNSAQYVIDVNNELLV